MNSESLRNIQSYSYGNEKPIVTFDATEVLLGQKLSNGITIDGYRGIAETQIEPVVSEQTTSQVQRGTRFWRASKKRASKNYQHRTYNCDKRRLAFVCYQMRKNVLYLLCVISARVQINSLVKFLSSKPRTHDNWCQKWDTLAGAKWFSTLNLKSRYWQVDVHPDDKEKTAFSMGQGLWKFIIIPFGLCNAPATFERLMETVLRGLTYDSCLVYLDDVIVKGCTFQEHLRNLRKVFERLREAHLKLNPDKCHLLQQEVRYLGHIVSPKGISTDPDKLKATQEWPTPRTKHKIRSFLSLCTYYRRFISGFTNIGKPLTKLAEEQQPFQWIPEIETAFQTLKGALCASPILAYPQPGERFIVDADSSNVGIGGVLSQVQDGKERVIAYYSKMLNKAERNYYVTRRELLAIVRTLERFHKYLYGQEFHLRTDHSVPTWLMSFKNLEGQTARWIQCLQEYNCSSSTVKARSTTMPMLSHNDPAKRSAPTATKSWHEHTSSKYEP
jgi:hypothetical protein